MGDARDTAKKKKADEKKSTKGPKLRPPSRPPKPSRPPRPPRSKACRKPISLNRAGGRLPHTGCRPRSVLDDREVIRSSLPDSDNPFPPAGRPGSSVGPESLASRVQAAGRQCHREGMRRHGKLLVRELPRQDLRRPGEVRLSGTAPEPVHPEQHPPIKLQPLNDPVLEEKPECPGIAGGSRPWDLRASRLPRQARR